MITILAVHISDGVLSERWWQAGLVVAVVMALVGCWRIAEEEIPRIALLTAAFFITSSIHIRIPGSPTGFHLLLNGLIGVVLGFRAPMAILLAVFLQCVLLGHGGLTTVGINSCVMAIPAIAAGFAFRWWRSSAWLENKQNRFVFISVCAFLWLVGFVFTIALLSTYKWVDPSVFRSWGVPLFEPAVSIKTEFVSALLFTFNLYTLIGLIILAFAMAIAVVRVQQAADFSLGLVIGGGAVLGSVALNCMVLLAGGEADWTYPAFLTVAMHLPLAAVEGVILGFGVCFLAKVKPEMLGSPAQ